MNTLGKWLALVGFTSAWYWLFNFTVLQSLFLAALCTGTMIFVFAILLDVQAIKRQLKSEAEPSSVAALVDSR